MVTVHGVTLYSSTLCQIRGQTCKLSAFVQSTICYPQKALAHTTNSSRLAPYLPCRHNFSTTQIDMREGLKHNATYRAPVAFPDIQPVGVGTCPVTVGQLSVPCAPGWGTRVRSPGIPRNSRTQPPAPGPFQHARERRSRVGFSVSRRRKHRPVSLAGEQTDARGSRGEDRFRCDSAARRPATAGNLSLRPNT